MEGNTMDDNRKLIYDLFGRIIPQKVSSVELGYGTFILIGFGKNITIEIPRSNEVKKIFRPEWHFWTDMCKWELKMENEILVSSEDDKKRIQKALTKLENKKLMRIELLNDAYDMNLMFENEIILHLISDNSEEDNEQWELFTPEKRVLIAGSLSHLSYNYSSQPAN